MPNLTREQVFAINHDYGDIMVSASAGSGKTFVMIERIIRLILERKAKVKELLAVTFTEAAAAEMKEKLKNALIKAINLGNQADAQYLMSEFNDVSTADISTVHAFCTRLIRTYFFSVGLSPDFAICDEAQASELQSNAVDKVFKDYYDAEDKDFLTLVYRHSKKREDGWFKKQVTRLYNYCRTEAQPEAILDRAVEFYSDNAQEKLLQDLLSSAKVKIQKVKNKLSQALKSFENCQLEKSTQLTKGLLSQVEYILNQNDVYQVAKFANEFNCKLSFEQKLTGQALEAKQTVSACRDGIKEILLSVRSVVTDAITDKERTQILRTHTIKLVQVVRRFGQEYSLLKREENLLDFNDLEHFAIEILNIAEIRENVKERYKFIFVDEFQDTNGVQEKLFELVSDDNLFAVGDVKQSIYGFRGCKPEIFSKRFDDMQNAGKATVTLNANFRSSRKVVEMVNDVFGFSMTKDIFGLDYSQTSQLQYGGGYIDEFGKEYEGRATLHLLEKEGRSTQSEEARVYDILDEIKKDAWQDTSNVSKLLADIINKEFGKEFFDLKERVVKRVTYKDVCILTRNKDNDYVQGIVGGLKRHGIPVVSEVAENVCDYPEIMAVVSALRLIDSFRDDLALATVLKSPIANFTDEDLYAIATFYNQTVGDNRDRNRTFYDTFGYYLNNANTPLRQRLLEFKNYFEQLRTLADFSSAYEIINELVSNCNLEAHLYATENGRLKVNRLRRFACASVVNNRHLSVKQFIDFIDREGAQIKLNAGQEQDAVRIMTIHASKGLEFPVVIVCGLERKSSTSEEHDEILCDREFGFAVKFYDDQKRTTSETLLRAMIKEKISKTRQQEELRLFYVALTRAAYSLHMTFEATKDERKKIFDGATKFLHYVPDFIEPEITELWQLDSAHVAKPLRKVLFGTPDADVCQKMQESLAYKYPFALSTRLPLKSSVTEALREEGEQEYYAVHELFEHEQLSNSSKERGIIAHKYLELLDFKDRLNAQSQVERLLNEGLMTKEQLAQIDIDKINLALKSNVFDGVNGNSVYREQSFLVSLPASAVFENQCDEQILLQGVIDLLIDEGDGFVIVDYKYSSLTATALKAKYKKQLELYALATQKITGKAVKKKAIVSLLTGEVAEV